MKKYMAILPWIPSPVCRLQGSDALAAAPAPQSEIQMVCHCSSMTTTTGWGEDKYLVNLHSFKISLTSTQVWREPSICD